MVLAFTCLLAFLFGPNFTLQANAQNIIAEIVGEFPYVYTHPDFDAPVIANLKPGAFYYVSKQKFPMGFHKIQISKAQTGFISSSEIKIVSAQYVQQRKKGGAAPLDSLEESVEKEQNKKAPHGKPIAAARYHGLIVEAQNFTEDTMSKTRNEAITFFGYRVVGNNTIFSGEMSTDLSLLFHSGAPKYYQEITGYPASGMMFNGHFTFDTLIPLSHSVLASYGFGPMFRYSHFEVNLRNPYGLGADYYALDDLTLGALLRLGAGFKWRSFSMRADIKYYIEAKQYLGLNLSTLFEF
jgi:hypothetical protein